MTIGNVLFDTHTLYCYYKFTIIEDNLLFYEALHNNCTIFDFKGKRVGEVWSG